jgi:hypothetical protein
MNTKPECLEQQNTLILLTIFDTFTKWSEMDDFFEQFYELNGIKTGFSQGTEILVFSILFIIPIFHQF